jgi:hypothetical protein
VRKLALFNFIIGLITVVIAKSFAVAAEKNIVSPNIGFRVVRQKK